MTAQDSKKERKRKAVKLTPKQATSFEKYRKQFLTHEDCAAAIGIHKHTVPRIMEIGRCAPDTYDKLIELNVIPAA